MNLKIYIGITKQKVENRWKKGSTYKGNPHFYSAIIKYGWDGFYHIVLASHLSKEQAFYYEETFIRELKTQDPAYGYNITGGGDVPITHNDVVRKKISESVSGEKHPCYGKHLSDETKKKISASTKGRKKAKNAGTQPKSIICIDNGIVYESTAEASRITGAHHSAITACLKKRRETANGLHWDYYNCNKCLTTIESAS